MSEKHIALEERHRALGGKMVPFAGFIMPLQYSGIIDEHLAVRRNVGLFDVSHMGEFEFRGSGAERFLNWMTVNNVAKLEVGQVQYSAMLYEDGGIVDDLLVYRFPDRFMMVVNAANIAKDWDWLRSHCPPDVEMTDRSDDITLLAVQGPRAAEVVGAVADVPVADIVYYHFREGAVRGVRAVISRTGYTGEDGFEIYVARRDSEALWEAVWEAGRPLGMKPAGLGARDSLRLEACYCLYGNDIDATTNPLEAGLGWIVKSKKPGGFLGLEAVEKARANPGRKLCGFIPAGRTIPRHGAPVAVNSRQVGRVTSGGWSPVLNQAVGLAYIDLDYSRPGTRVEVDSRGKPVVAEIVQIPFYKRR